MKVKDLFSYGIVSAISVLDLAFCSRERESYVVNF